MHPTKKKILEHHDDIAKAQAEYHAAKGDETKQREATLRLKAHRKALSETIAEGALPCKCGAGIPHGMMHPKADGGIQYEVGCLSCPAKIKGGLIPRHAVEAWNEEFGKAPAPEEKPS